MIKSIAADRFSFFRQNREDAQRRSEPGMVRLKGGPGKEALRKSRVRVKGLEPQG